MEITRTIRAFFVFFGFLDAFMHYSTLEARHEVVWISVLGLVRGISYLCVGLALPALLSRHTWAVESVLVAGACYSFLLAYARIFLEFLSEERDSVAEVLWRLVTTVFLTLYVFNHVKRLSVQQKPPC